MQSGTSLKVLVACEFSGIVRDAFIAHGHNAVSIDLVDTESPGPHIQDDVLNYLNEGWDLMIAHPPCTFLCNAGAQYHKGYEKETYLALAFVKALMNAPIPYIAIENPVGLISTYIRKPDQIIYPWQFGHIDKKRTCLWTKGLPILAETKRIPVLKRKDTIRDSSQNKDRKKRRSIFFEGIADAMAEQWGSYANAQLESAYWA
jgi:hypothetical protein